MKYLKQLFFVALLGLSGAARADIPWVPMDPGSPGQFTNYWTFSSGTASKGDFDLFFAFNVPDTEIISLKALATAGSISFAGGAAALYELGSGNLLGLTLATGSTPFTTDSWTLSSGTYVFELAGSRSTDGASFNAVVMGLPVPEPTSIAMLLAGLIMLAGVSRARSRKN